MTSHYLEGLFSPKSIAVFGASERPEAVGAQVFRNLIGGGFEGSIHAINPSRTEVQGRICHASIAAVGQSVDLAVIATPAATVPEIVHQCGENGVRVAAVLSAGFGEGDGSGAEHRKALLMEARRYRMRVLGPNCLGFVRPELGINATFSKNSARPGSLALISQSGALCTAILDWAESHGVGFSAVTSIGSAADVGFGDLLDYFALDPSTESILLYVEGVGRPRQFMSGLRAAARLKPVIVLKAGRHPSGSRAAISHTGSLVGEDDSFDAALRRAGAVRAMTIEQLFAAAQLLSSHDRVRGNRLAIVTNAGGPGVMAADRATDLEVQLAALGQNTLLRLDENLPAHWSKGNPVDILGDAPPRRYGEAVRACLEDDDVDGVLAMLTPQAMTDPTEAARSVVAAAQGIRKPVLTCWMGGNLVLEARELLTDHGIPTFPNPETSVEAFSYLARYHENQQQLLQVPGPFADRRQPDVEGARLILEGALAEGRKTLSVTESKALLTAFRIPVTQAVEARSANEALVAAESLGFPVAMKVASHDLTHKSDVGGVRLDIQHPRDVRTAFNDLTAHVHRVQPSARIAGVTVERMIRRSNARELFVGVSHDPAFGPVIGFGAGGTSVEVLRDRAVALPPLNSFLVRGLVSQTRIARMLVAFRNMPAVDMGSIEQVLLRVSEMVCELPEIVELDINPLIVDEDGALALDARVVARYPDAAQVGYGHMAIHPYPGRLASRCQLADGTDITIRPIRPEDAQIEAAFVRNLSEESRYFRFMQTLRELTPSMLVRFTQIDYDREMALIAVTEVQGQEIQIAVARYITNPDGDTCEFALVVADEWQRRSIGRRVMQALMECARERRLRVMEGEVLSSNQAMLRLVRSLGFSSRADPKDLKITMVSCEL